MRVNGDVFIAGTGVWLARTVQPLDEAVEAALAGAEHSAPGDVSALVDDEGVAAPDLAIAAARRAVERFGADPVDFGLPLHAAPDFTEERTLWRQCGRHVGHVGAGDRIAGLDYLVEHRRPEPGDRAMLFAAGMGFDFSAAFLEITHPNSR